MFMTAFLVARYCLYQLEYLYLTCIIWLWLHEKYSYYAFHIICWFPLGIYFSLISQHLITPKSLLQSLILELYFYPLSPSAILSSIRDLILKPHIDLLTVGALCRMSLSVNWDLGFYSAVACDRVSSATIHHGGHTLRELYFQLDECIHPHDALSSFILLPCDEEETGEGMGGRCQKKVALCFGATWLRENRAGIEQSDGEGEMPGWRTG